MINSKWIVAVALFLLNDLAWSQAQFDFYPTDAEWVTMPQYCKARYVVSSTGRSSKWAYDFPTPEIESWQARLGSCWGMAHHQCAGMIHLNRAKAAPNAGAKRYALERAQDELTYASKHCPSDNPFSATLLTSLAMVYAEQGKKTEAIATLDAAITRSPATDSAYIAKSILLTRDGKTKEARALLLNGLDETNGGTAELNNAIGLSYFATKEYEKAREYARKAYAMGYPLPGLSNKLKRAGYPL